MEEHKETLNNLPQEEDSNSENNDLIFSSKAINDICSNTDTKVSRNNYILNYIKKNAPICPYRLAKELDMSYPLISQIIKDLEYGGVIKTRVVLGENNRAKRQIVIPDTPPKYKEDGK